MNEENKKKIDSMSYEQLLRKWRFHPIGEPEPLFVGDTGDYYQKVMLTKKEQLGGEAVAVSKKIGW